MKFKVFILVFATLLLSGCAFFDKQKNSGIQVITNDIASSVFINGQYLEKAPLIEKDIQPGSYTIRIQPDNPSFVPYETNVTLRKGLLTVITWKPGKRPETSGGVIYEMEPISSDKSEITFISIPDGAIVSLDGGEKTFAPTTYEKIEPGHHEFEVTLPSYQTQRHTINALAGQRMLINIKLAKSESQERVEKAADAVTPTPVPSTVDATASAVPTATTSAVINKVTIQPTNFFQQSIEVLQVRSSPNAIASEVGYVEVGKSYPYVERQTEWFNISFDGKTGWVSSQYAVVQ